MSDNREIIKLQNAVVSAKGYLDGNQPMRESLVAFYKYKEIYKKNQIRSDQKKRPVSVLRDHQSVLH